jgi:hypothetical protein
MTEFIKERFVKAVNTLDSFYEFQKKENASLDEITKNLQELYNFTWSDISNISIFNDSILRLFNIRTDANNEEYLERTKGLKIAPVDILVAKSLYIDLLEILDKNLKSKKFPSKDYKAYFDSLDLEEWGNFYMYTPSITIPENFKKLNIDNFKQVKSKPAAIELQIEMIAIIEDYINDILLFNIKKWFDKTEIEYSYIEYEEDIEYFKNLRINYTKSWLDCTVTASSWNVFSRDDLWEELDKLNLTDEKKEEIENHQHKLFFEELSYSIWSAMLSFNSTHLGDKKTVIEKELMLLTNFINGDISDVIVDRIRKIIDIDDPKEVLIAFDEITKCNIFCAYDSYKYIPKKRKIISPKFSAYFINGYTKRLELELKKFPLELVPTKKETTIPTFTFKIIAIATRKKKATDLFEALVKEKHVDINSKNDFINAFIGTPPDSKINWTGLFGDLKSFINYSISEKLIENVPEKWLYTVNLFTENGIQISNKRINSAKKTTGDNKIKNIVRSIL